MNFNCYSQLDFNQFSSLIDSIPQFNFDLTSPDQHQHLDEYQYENHQSIDPRLKNQSIHQSKFIDNLDPTHPDFLSNDTPQSISLEPEHISKRVKFNSANRSSLALPSFESPIDNQDNWKDLEINIEDQIEALIADSLTVQMDSNKDHPKDFSISKPNTSTFISSIETTGIIENDLLLGQSIEHQTSDPPISTLVPEPTSTESQIAQSDPVSSILVDHDRPLPLPSSANIDPSIDPSLKALHPILLIPSFPLPMCSPCDQIRQPECTQKEFQPKSSESTSDSPSSIPVIYTKLSQVDVHGAGAGGGAAAVLEAVAAHQHQFKDPTSFAVNWNKDPIIKPKKQIRKKPISKSISHQNKLNNNQCDFNLTSTPTSYNPDQFRSWNRIHWTKDEEQLLLKEVELHWHHYDCMAQIMKRHGPTGTISKTFADRTGVSLKDKAVNISSRWYRDGTEISPTRRQAFARFRPKQLKGKPKSELPGMIQLSNFLDSAKPSSSSGLLENPPPHK